MRRGRPIAPLMLTQEEQATLERWARRPKSAQALAQRARVILACADGWEVVQPVCEPSTVDYQRG